MKTITALAASFLLALHVNHNPSPKNPVPLLNLAQFIGDTPAFQIPLTWADAPFIPNNNWSLIFTAKAHATDLDANALIQKTSGAGITVTGSTASVAMVPQDTQGLSPATIVWDVQAVNTSTGAVCTVAQGSLNLVRDVTRGTTTSIAVYTENPPVIGTPGPSAYQVAVNNGFVGTQQQWLASLTTVAPTSTNIAAALGYTPAAVHAPLQLSDAPLSGSPNGLNPATAGALNQLAYVALPQNQADVYMCIWSDSSNIQWIKLTATPIYVQ